jgi:GTP 3',8-cyclase
MNPQDAPLLDQLGRPLRDLRISVTDRCTLRCTYCMPAEVFGPDYAFLPKEEILSFEELERLSRLFVGLGVRKLRITGGEPLLRAQLEQLVFKLSSLEGVEDIALTTNGLLLPRKAQALKDAGLGRVTVSLDALEDELFGRMNGRGVAVSKVLNGIEAAASVGLPVKVNMVVQRGINDGQLEDMARYFKGKGHILRFIEFMDVGNHNGWQLEEVVSSGEIVRRLSGSVAPLEPINPEYVGEVASKYRYADGGEVGFISSVTAPFCGDCSRARISASGMLYTCLFASEGVDLKVRLRDGSSDEEIVELLRAVWGVRSDRYSELRAELTREAREGKPKLEMSHIGG